MSVNSRVKANYIDILVTSRNGDINHAIYQNNEKTSFEKKELEPVEPVQKNIYQSNTYKKTEAGYISTMS